MNGRVDRIVEKKGFGFIKGEDNRDYFFHKEDFNGFWADLVHDSNYRKMIIQVNFQEGDTPKGLRAREVNRLDHPNQSVSDYLP